MDPPEATHKFWECFPRERVPGFHQVSKGIAETEEVEDLILVTGDFAWPGVEIKG